MIPNNAATPSDEITVEAISAARFVLFGGEPLDGPRHRLVEPCLKLAGANRASQSGLEKRPVRAGASDSDFSKRVKFKTAEGEV